MTPSPSRDFKKAAFQGGTCLRVLYGHDRFSEDLDFILQNPNPRFVMEPFLRDLHVEFQSFGYAIEVQDRSKADLPVKKAFIKDDSIGKVLHLAHRRGGRTVSIKVKIEVDVNPPKKSRFGIRYLDFPYPFVVVAQDPPTLFASKSHALLCRTYVKGRDWYDFLWYVARKTPLNFSHLSEALHQMGPWKGKHQKVGKSWYLKNMEEKIYKTDWKEAKQDLHRFLKPRQQETLNLWSQEFFLDRIQKLRECL